MRRNVEWLDFQRFNRSHGPEHFVVVGASGSGKTTVINNLMASILPTGTMSKAIIYDPKQEVIPLVYQLRGVNGPTVTSGTASVKVLNPFDTRCCAWDMARDIDSVISARQLATILIQESKSAGGAESFFTNAIRDILTAVIVAFIECTPNANSWTFRDILLTALYEPYLRFVLNRTNETRDGKLLPMLHRVRETYLGTSADARTVGNIKASMSAKLAIYEPIAAAWHKAAPTPSSPRMISLRQWALGTSEDILVLGNDEAARASLDAINRAIFKRATELVLSRDEQSEDDKASGTNQVWFFLDEVREAGELDGLSRLLTKGRSKGACVVMGFQDMDGLRDVYGEEVANEICAQCNNLAILRLNSPSTAQWASDLFGRRLTQSKNSGTSLQTGTDSGGLNVSRGSSEEERPYLYTDSFLYLKTAREAAGVVGFCKGPHVNLAGMTNAEAMEKLSFRTAKETKLSPLAGSWQQPLCARPPSDYLLEPWTEDDWERLGFREPMQDLVTNAPDADALGIKPRLPRKSRIED